MEDHHRVRIQKCLKELEGVDLAQVSGFLIEKGIIDSHFVQKIKAKFPSDCEFSHEFFLRLRKRGPEAFSLLLEALAVSGDYAVAEILRDEGEDEGPRPRQYRQYVVNSSDDDEEDRRLRQRRLLPPPSSSSSASSSTSSMSMGQQNIVDTQIQKAVTYNMGKTSEDEAYRMMTSPRGYALIVNNVHFPGDPKATRNGAANDMENLYLLLTDLGFKVETHTDVTKVQLIDRETGILRNFIDKFKLQDNDVDVDACVVAILSHGTENQIRTSDPGHASVNVWEDIVTPFNNEWAPHLLNKPKIFIVQACRGDGKDQGIRSGGGSAGNSPAKRRFPSGSVTEQCLSPEVVVNNDEIPYHENDPTIFPSFEDILICYSTIPGYVSNRDTETGTWYITHLCHVFRENAHDHEITDMLKKLGKRMKGVNSEHGHKQMSSFLNVGFHHNLYFNPGLHESR